MAKKVVEKLYKANEAPTLKELAKAEKKVVKKKKK